MILGVPTGQDLLGTHCEISGMDRCGKVLSSQRRRVEGNGHIGSEHSLFVDYYFERSSERILGVNGIQKSLDFILLFKRSIFENFEGLQSIERFPSARAPHSSRPAQRATISS